MPRTIKPVGPPAAAVRTFEERFAKEFGVNTIGVPDDPKSYRVISTGSLGLDYELGVGGWVCGRINEIYGIDDLGKSTLALMACREAQEAYPDLLAAYIDMEHKLDLPWAYTHGVDRNRFRPVWPDNAQQVSDMLKKMCQSGLFSIIVLDSVGSMIAQAEHDKEADADTVALVAKIVSRMVRSNAVWAAKNNTCLLLINQVIANIGSYGPDTVTPGGWKLKFGSTVKVQLKRTDKDVFSIGTGREKRVVGHEIAARIERNKCAPKGRSAYISLVTVGGTKFGPIGIDKADEAATLGERLGLIERGGSFYTLPVTGEKVNGRDKLVEALRMSPEVISHIREQAIASRSNEVVVAEEDDEDLKVEGVEGVEIAETKVTEPKTAPKPSKGPQKGSGPAKATPATKKAGFRRGASTARSAQGRAS